MHQAHSRTVATFTLSLATLFLCGVVSDGAAQSTRAGSAAADALVLSGGGARGIAHAGALVGLAQAGFSPELVVGNSIGAIVGSLYAAGLEPTEIWAIFADQDWQALFEPYAVLVGPRRRPLRPLVSVGVRTTERRPIDGVIPDARVNRRLVEILFDANMRARGDFDRLPRRYRAVSADLATGAIVPIARGDLARAVRSSMSVPGVFAPIVWDGRVLVDGGIADYLPVDVAAGAQRVVAVDVIRPRLPLGRPNPLMAALRAFRLTLWNTLPDTAADLVILPDIPQTTSAAMFPVDPTPLLRIGLDAAERAMPPPALPIRSVPPAAPAAAPDSIAGLVIDAHPSLESIVRAAFRSTTGSYDPGAVLRAIDRLYATGLFAGIWPAPVPVSMPPDGRDAEAAAARSVKLSVRAESTPPLDLLAAAGYGRDRGVRTWLRTAWRPGAGPWTVGASILYDGLETQAAAEARVTGAAFAPLAFTVGGGFIRTDIPFALPKVDRVDRIGGWLGIDYRVVDPEILASLTVRAESIDTGAGPYSAIGPYLRVEREHPASWPVGGPLLLEAELRGGGIAYQRARISAQPAFRFGPLRFAPVLDLTVTGDDTPTDVQPALGDEHALPGLEWGEDRAPTRVIAGADLAVPVPAGAFLRLRLRSGAATAGPDDWFNDEPWLGGAALELFLHSPLGDFVIGWGAATNGATRFELQLGSQF